MKTVKGEVLTTTPVSISKAASILSKFVSADTGASQVVCAYLRRASVSFNELNQLHKELKSHRKHKAPNSETLIEDGEPTRSFISNQHDGEEIERKKHKKHKKEKDKGKERGWFGNIVKSDGESVEDKVSLKIEESDLVEKKHKKNRGEVANLEEGKGRVKIEEDGIVGIEDNDIKKHKKNKGENGDEILVKEEEGKRKKKKRKIEEVEEGRERNSEESRSKKKKKIKSEVEG